MSDRIASDELQWVVLRDFTGGLYGLTDERAVPPNGLTVADDAVPVASGGLRPSFQWTTHVNTTELTSAATTAGFISSGVNQVTTGRLLMGFGVFEDGGYGNSFVGLNHFFVKLGVESSEKADQTVWEASPLAVFPTTAGAQSGLVFSFLRTHSSVERWAPTKFVQFSHSTGTQLASDFIYNITRTTAAASNEGVFRRRYASGAASTVVQISTTPSHHVEAHQARLLSVQMTSAFAFAETLAFSDDGTDNNLDSTANRMIVAANRADDITFVQSRMPGDLAILKRGRGWFTINGALSQQPVIYESQRVRPPGSISYGTETPLGLAYLTADEGVWAFTGGRDPIHLSPQFDGTPMTANHWPGSTGGPPVTTLGTPQFIGQPAYGGHFLYTPRGHMWDSRTRSWHLNTQLNAGGSTTPWWFSYAPHQGRVYAARNTTAGGVQIWSMDVSEEEARRSTVMTWEVPVYSRDGRVTSPAELEFAVESHTSRGRLEVAVVHPTPSGVDTTVLLGPYVLGGSRHETVRVRVPALTGGGVQWFKVRPTLRSLSTNPAPSLDHMRIGVRGGAPTPVPYATT